MTGATGDLTPDEVQRDFQPGEWREASGAEHQGDVTRAQGSTAPAQGGSRDATSHEGTDVGPTELAGRESGYGTHAGLSPDDPAYRMDTPPAPPRVEDVIGADADGGARPDGTRIGGDERSDHEDHL